MENQPDSLFFNDKSMYFYIFCVMKNNLEY